MSGGSYREVRTRGLGNCSKYLGVFKGRVWRESAVYQSSCFLIWRFFLFRVVQLVSEKAARDFFLCYPKP